MANTKEQQVIIDTSVELFNTNKSELLKVEAVAGSGKTYTLVKLTEAIDPKTGLYLAYNKAIATSSESKFKHLNIKCQTIHSLAYRATVNRYGLKVGVSIKPRDIKGGLSYYTAIDVVDTIENFCLSKYTSFEAYAEDLPEELSETVVNNVTDHLEKMADGRATCSHSFYLKLYHILLDNGEIKAPDVELLLLDESGDVTELTLEIFKLIKAKLKLMVGDSAQNIYSFNKTINGFHAMKDEGTTCHLSQSFRVNAPIAKKIQSFMRKYVDKKYEFKGQKYQDYEIKTEAYIARTNAGLIEQMDIMRRMGIAFNLSRTPGAIFGTVLTLLSVNSGKPIQNPSMKFLEKDIKRYNNETSLRRKYSSVTAYIMSEHKEDQELKSAITLINRFTPNTIWEIFDFVKENYSKNNSYDVTLTTCHSSKGNEWDKVTILKDCNEALAVTLMDYIEYKHENKVEPPEDHEIYQEINLYYVAVSRCLYELKNATHLLEVKQGGESLMKFL
jgi:superfamily I DNA/RNA helicase